jgi:hypothetical protein
MSNAPTRIPKLNQSKFRLSEHVSLNYVAQPEYGVTLAQVLDDAYWGHVAALLKAGYTIECMPEGLTWYAKLIVVDAGPVHAKVKVLQFTDLLADTPKVEQSPILAQQSLGPKFRAERAGAWFRVARVSDGEVMKTGFRSLAAAAAWASENLQVELA